MSARNHNNLTPLGRYIEKFVTGQDAIANPTELAKKAGMHHTTLFRWMRGEADPRPEKLDDLAKVMGVDPYELRRIAGEDVPPTVDTLNPHALHIARRIHELPAPMQSAVLKSLNATLDVAEEVPGMSNDDELIRLIRALQDVEDGDVPALELVDEEIVAALDADTMLDELGWHKAEFMEILLRALLQSDEQALRQLRDRLAAVVRKRRQSSSAESSS